MKRICLVAVLLLFVMQGITLALDSYEEIKLKDGRTLKKVTVTEVLPDGLKLSHSDGGGRFTAELLPDDIRAKYKLDTPEAAQAAVDRKKQEDDEVRRSSEALAGYPQIYLTLKKDILDHTAKRRTKMAQRGASGDKRDAFEARQHAFYDACVDAVKECEATGTDPDLCRKWIQAAMDEQILNGMPLKFVVIAWGKPESMDTYHSGAVSKLVYGNNCVYMRDGVVSDFKTSSK